MTVLLPRGLAAGVLATFPVAAGLPSSSEIPGIVYAAVITTIVGFAVALPLAKGRLESEVRDGALLETGVGQEPARVAAD